MEVFETKIIELIRNLLGVDFEISSALPIDLVGKTYYPDGVIYYDRIPIAVFDIRHNLQKDPFLPQTLELLRRYISIAHLPIAFVTDGENVVSLENGKESKAGGIPLSSFIANIVKRDFERRELGEGQAKELIKNLIQSLKESNISEDDEFHQFITNLSMDIIRKESSFTGQYLMFSESFERSFFFELLGAYNNDKICRYTSLKSALRILNEGKESVCSIIGMNDKSECYYADQYLKDVSVSFRLSDLPISETKELNSYLIMSCSDISKLDKLTMWRMYGDEAKGVCFKFNIKRDMMKQPIFYLAPVSYANENGSHPKLEFIKRVISISIAHHQFRFNNLNLWEHFFKPFEYIDESEVRLLYFCQPKDRNKYKWITTGNGILCPIVEFNIEKSKPNEFPLEIESITLGPKCTEKYTNKPELAIYANSRNLYSLNNRISINISKIENYR